MSVPAECPEMDLWQTLFEGTLPAEEQDRCERHLESCPRCQERLDVPGEFTESLRALARQAGDPTVLPPDPTWRVVLGRMQGERSPQHPGPGDAADLSFLRPPDRPGGPGTLGGYEVLEVVGQGGMGMVLKAFEPALHRTVAIKVLAAALAGNATARLRFTREARAAAAVCHDNIVPVYGVSETAGLPYLVMQYVAGESLQDRLDRGGPLEVTEIVRIGMQTASGLAAAHAQGLIHRDVKPANLLLENGLAKVKITDFGLARMADDAHLTQSGVVAGTPEYMAPEQARGEAVDHRADLFSLGSVLYACCTGLPPFRGSTMHAVLRRVSEEEPKPIRALNPDVPAWLEALIAHLMGKEPARRLQGATEVAALLQGYLAHLHQPATVPAPKLPSLQASRRAGPPAPGVASRFPQRFWLPALVLLATLGLGVACWLAAGDGGTDPKAGAAGAAAGPPALKARFHQDLRSADLEHSLLRPMGEGVSLEADGVRITLPPGQGMPGAGLATNAEVHGDFEITGSFTILKADRPAVGYGVGVSLFVAIDPDTNDAVTLARRVLPDGRTVFVSNRMTPVNGELRHNVKTLPSTAAAGKLRIRRVGAKVQFLVAEGDNVDFVQVDEVDFPTADVRFVQFGANTGRAESGLDVRLLDFTLRAESFAGAAESWPDLPASDSPRAGGKRWWAAGLCIGLVTFSAGLSVWLYGRSRRRTGKATTPAAGAGEPVRAAGEGSVPFPCPDCGRRLKARVELAGKKVQCPGCRKAVVVPDGAAGAATSLPGAGEA
jgi:serine/threonine protein kinase